MEVITREILYSSTSTTFKIFPLGDAHLGSPDCDEDLFQQTVDKIARDKNAYWGGMGDMADCILPGDKRFDMKCLADWVKQDNIAECQRQRIKKILTPIANKCLWYLSGNHEETIHKFFNTDISKNICDDLKLPYSGYSAFVSLDFRKTSNGEINQIRHMPLLLHVRHGSGAAQTEGARTMTLMRLVNAFSADIYLMGHLHCITTYSPERLELGKGNRIHARKVNAVITGSWLKAYQQGEGISYAEMKGYKPTQLGCPIILVTPQNNQFQIVT